MLANTIFRPPSPGAYSDPYSRPMSTMSSSTNGVDTAWRRRQTIKRGVTRKVKLTNGNFITEYPVPTPVHSAIEARYRQTNTTEFSSVFTSCIHRFLRLTCIWSTGTCGIVLPPVIQMNSQKRTAGRSERKCSSARPNSLSPSHLITKIKHSMRVLSTA